MSERGKLTDEDLASIADELRNGSLTFSKIGKKYGVTGQRIQQINVNRFKVNARARETKRTQERHKQTENTLKPNHYNEPIRAFIKRAKESGVAVLPFILYTPDSYITGIANTVLKLNGKTCVVHIAKSNKQAYVKQNGEVTAYYAFSIRPDKRFKAIVPKFYVLIAAKDKRYFIVPKSFVERYSGSNARIYIPVRPRQDYNNRRPKVEYLTFENRFDLLLD